MAWTTPMTAVANTALTAAQWNAHVRDNFLETAPAKATAAGQMFVSTGTNAIAARTPVGLTTAAAQTTTSTSYVDLTTVTSLSCVTGTSAIVAVSATSTHTVLNGTCRVSWAVSGATTIAASDQWAAIRAGLPIGTVDRRTAVRFTNALNPGTNTFTMKYDTSAATATFSDRHLVVIPL